MNETGQRLCLLSGPACIVIFFLGFWVIAGFIPPPSPLLTGEEVVSLFLEDRNRIRVGMIFSLFASALLASWAAAVTVQLQGIDSRNAALAYTNLAVGALFVLEFIFSLVIWQSMTFRLGRDPQLMQAMNDTAWLLFVCITSTPALQAVVIGFAVLRDQRKQPLLPRWLGYLNLWVAVLFLPGTITVFFHNGPFAWNGLFTWYVPLGVFALWIVCNTVCMLKALGHQERIAGTIEERAVVTAAQLTEELNRLQQQLVKLSTKSATK